VGRKGSRSLPAKGGMKSKSLTKALEGKENERRGKQRVTREVLEGEKTNDESPVRLEERLDG